MDKKAASDVTEMNIMVMILIAVAIIALIVVVTKIIGRS